MTVLQFDDEYKAPVQTMDLVIGCIIGTLFTTLALVDLSVVEMGQPAFIAQYLIWKANAPFLKPVLMIITLLLPLALLGAVMNVFKVFTKKSTVRRNVCDVLNVVALTAVIFNTAAFVGPAEGKIFDLGLQATTEALAQVADLLPELRQYMAISLILNVFMLFLPLFHAGDVDVIPRVAVQDTKTKKD